MDKITKRTNKWCMGCGRHVDLRKKGACQLTERFCVESGYKNKHYHYVCSRECYNKMHNLPANYNFFKPETHPVSFAETA